MFSVVVPPEYVRFAPTVPPHTESPVVPAQVQFPVAVIVTLNPPARLVQLQEPSERPAGMVAMIVPGALGHAAHCAPLLELPDELLPTLDVLEPPLPELPDETALDRLDDGCELLPVLRLETEDEPLEPLDPLDGCEDDGLLDGCELLPIELPEVPELPETDEPDE